MKIKPFFREALKYLLPAPLFWRLLARRIGYFDPELRLLKYLCERTKVSIDVGASMGSYTVHLLNHSRKCYVFEPRPDAVSSLVHKLTAGGHPRLHVENVALSDFTGESKLRVLVDDKGRSSIEKANPVELIGTVEILIVPTRRLDDYDSIEPVGFIKIDVEGHEDAVLHGARRLLLRDHPSLIIEIEERHKRHSVSTVNAFLQELGYKGYFFRDGHLIPIRLFDAGVHQNTSNIAHDANNRHKYINNFVFVVDESLVKVQHLIKGD